MSVQVPEKQKAVMEAALKLFTEKGFHGTPTSKIAKDAKVATGTLFHYFKTHGIATVDNKVVQTVGHLVAAFFSAGMLFFFAYKHEKKVREAIFGTKNTFFSFLKGVGYALLAYPFVLLFVQLLYLLLHKVISVQQEQVALLELHYVQDFPWLFWLLSACIVTLIPFVEELLFGFPSFY